MRPVPGDSVAAVAKWAASTRATPASSPPPTSDHSHPDVQAQLDQHDAQLAEHGKAISALAQSQGEPQQANQDAASEVIDKLPGMLAKKLASTVIGAA